MESSHRRDRKNYVTFWSINTVTFSLSATSCTREIQLHFSVQLGKILKFPTFISPVFRTERKKKQKTNEWTNERINFRIPLDRERISERASDHLPMWVDTAIWHPPVLEQISFTCINSRVTIMKWHTRSHFHFSVSSIDILFITDSIFFSHSSPVFFYFTYFVLFTRNILFFSYVEIRNKK